MTCLKKDCYGELVKNLHYCRGDDNIWTCTHCGIEYDFLQIDQYGKMESFFDKWIEKK